VLSRLCPQTNTHSNNRTVMMARYGFCRTMTLRAPSASVEDDGAVSLIAGSTSLIACSSPDTSLGCYVIWTLTVLVLRLLSIVVIESMSLYTQRDFFFLLFPIIQAAFLAQYIQVLHDPDSMFELYQVSANASGMFRRFPFQGLSHRPGRVSHIFPAHSRRHATPTHVHK